MPADAGDTVHRGRPAGGRGRAELRGHAGAGAGTVDAEFDRLFSRDAAAATEGEVEIDPEAEVPEPLVGGRLDLGEILAEELSLALDPYPRSPEADRLLAELAARADGGKGPWRPPLRRH